VNKRTGEEFYGCSNYPRCHYSCSADAGVVIDDSEESSEIPCVDLDGNDIEPVDDYTGRNKKKGKKNLVKRSDLAPLEERVRSLEHRLDCFSRDGKVAPDSDNPESIETTIANLQTDAAFYRDCWEWLLRDELELSAKITMLSSETSSAPSTNGCCCGGAPVVDMACAPAPSLREELARYLLDAVLFPADTGANALTVYADAVAYWSSVLKNKDMHSESAVDCLLHKIVALLSWAADTSDGQCAQDSAECQDKGGCCDGRHSIR